MSMSLNGWQRLWVVVAVLLLGGFLLVLGTELPSEDRDVVRQLQAPECQVWRSFPRGYILAEPPRAGDPCYKLVYYQWMHEVNLHSVEEYEQRLRSEKVKLAVVFFVAWFVFIASIYVFGWAVAWVRRGFRRTHGT